MEEDRPYKDEALEEYRMAKRKIRLEREKH